MDKFVHFVYCVIGPCGNNNERNCRMPKGKTMFSALTYQYIYIYTHVCMSVSMLFCYLSSLKDLTNLTNIYI